MFTDYIFDVMNKDEVVAHVEVTDDRKNIKVDKFQTNVAIQPFCGGKVDLDRIQEFLEFRCFEEARPDKKELLKRCGLEAYDPWEIVKRTHGRLWSDHLWIRFPEEKLTWEDVTCGKDKAGQEYAVFSKLNSKGSLVKFCKDGYWYKLDQVGREGVAEELTSVVLSHSNVSDFVTYKRCKINGRTGCRAKDFLQEGEVLISFQNLYQNYVGGKLSDRIFEIPGMEERLDYLVAFIRETTGLSCLRYLQDVFALDYLVRNPDRHFHNLAVIMNAEGAFRPAPIFDNGQGLLQNHLLTPTELSLEEKEFRLTAATISGSFEKQMQTAGNKLELDYEGLYRALEEYPESMAKDYLLHSLEENKRIFRKEKQA